MKRRGGWTTNVLPAMPTSCRGCQDRTVGCHASCEKYAADLRRREQLRQEIRKEAAVGAVAAEADNRWKQRRNSRT